jgi:septal ring factor EnvC (AmiA/AmiB activator)
MTSEPENHTRDRLLTFSPHIDLGHLLQAATVAIAAVVYVIAYAGKTDQAIQIATDAKIEMAKQIAELKTTITTGNAELRTAIAGLPDVSARLTQTERRLDSVEQANRGQETELNDLKGRAVVNRADIDNLLRASRIDLRR